MTQLSVVSQLVDLLKFENGVSTSQVSVPSDAWDDLAIAAIALGLAPLLHVRTQDLTLPPQARAKLAITYAASQRRNQAIAGQLAELLAAYDSADIDVIVLKGGHLAFGIYPDPALRGMSDLDLLFHPRDLPAAEEVLRALGYEGKHKPAEEGPGVTKHTSTYRRAAGQSGSTPNPYLSTAGDRHVDPHGSLEESWFGLRVDVTPGAWERSRPAVLAGRPALVLAPEDLLLHLSVHLVFHLLMGKPSLVQLYDLAIVSDRLPPDWDRLVARSQECGAEPFLYAGLHLASIVFAAPVPDNALAGLRQTCPAGLAGTIDGIGLDHVMQQTQRPPLTNLRQRLARGITDRRETARWATTWEAKWAVWRTALAVGRTDTGRLIGQRLRERLSLES